VSHLCGDLHKVGDTWHIHCFWCHWCGLRCRHVCDRTWTTDISSNQWKE